MPNPIVSPEELAARIADPDLRLIDFRLYLDGRSTLEAYRSAHIPGAVFVDVARVTGGAGPGRHPLPGPDQFASAMRAAGVSGDSRVVVYDDAHGSVAARLWWMLRHHGHREVSVLDGGLQSWPGPLETGERAVAPGDFVPGPPLDGGTVDLDGIVTRPPGAVLIDARAGERYRGEVEPVDPRPGHIPGALSAEWMGNLGPDGRLLPPERLRARFRALGLTAGPEAIASCGSGVTACHNLLAMEVAGLTGGRLYVGSWSEWSRRPDLPAALGPEPGNQ